MSTRSAIGVVTWDGKIKAVYCHYDGYIEGVGAELVNFYKDVFKVNQLIDNGNISTLAKTIKETKFYASVESNKFNQSKSFDTIQEFVTYYKDSWCEYFYLFENDSWTVSTGNNFEPLKEKVYG